MQNRITIAGLAREAGVSRQCVRRFIAGDRGQEAKNGALAAAYVRLGGAIAGTPTTPEEIGSMARDRLRDSDTEHAPA
jgi:hypothetical protein